MEQPLYRKISDGEGLGDDIIRQLGNSVINNIVRSEQRHIYLVGENLIAKRRHQRVVEYECDMGNYLSENGVRVPKMHGVISSKLLQKLVDLSKVSEPDLHTISCDWFLVMQRINGEDLKRGLDTIPKEDIGEVIRQFKEQITKVLELGINPYDSLGNEGFEMRNAIFDEKERKLYLIDFEYWERVKWKHELTYFYDLLKKA